MIFDELYDFVRNNVPKHLRHLWDFGVETALEWPDHVLRIPRNGNEKPYYNNHSYYPQFDSLYRLGVSGWNYKDKKTSHITIDLDGVNHANGLTDDALSLWVDRLTALEEVEIIRSKSGRGIHVRLYFDPPPRAATRKEHIDNAKRAFRWLCVQIGQDFDAATDCVGCIAWIWASETGERGFELLKRSTKTMPADWDSIELPSKSPIDCESLPITPAHQKLIDWLQSQGLGEWDNLAQRLITHTHQLLLAHEALGCKGEFATIATGKDGPSDQNCFAYPRESGSWQVFRYGIGTKEHESWWRSSNGYTTTWFNRASKKPKHAADKLVHIGRGDELFHDENQRTFVVATFKGIRETMPLNDPRFRARLRLSYTEETGVVARIDDLKTALDHLSSMAIAGRQYMVAIRLGEYGNSLYLDLANQRRDLVKITKNGWELTQDAPVRFIRPAGMLPLPVPERGSLDDLLPYVNVNREDLSWLLAFMVGCFHPRGPFALLQITGEPGSAKSSLMRLIQDFVDPHVCVGDNLEKDAKNLLVIAQTRRLLSFDNIDHLDRRTSSLLCTLITGAASSQRKLYTDDDTSILTAKRPVVITSVGQVVNAPDLQDRTITLVLPTIPTARRRTEHDIECKLREGDVRGKILGYLLDGVVSALAKRNKTCLDDSPRLADLFEWATAAESGLGLSSGSVLEAYQRQRNDDTEHGFLSDDFARRIIELCKEGFEGTATELAKKVNLGQSAVDVGRKVRELAPDLRRRGYGVREGRIGTGQDRKRGIVLFVERE